MTIITTASQEPASFTPSDHQAIDLLRTLVEIPSISRSEWVCAETLVHSMSTLGLDARIDESGSAVGVRGSSYAGASEILLLGHIDTVPGHVPVRVEDGCLYGRGSVDAKGPLAAFAIAAARARLTPGTRVRVIGAVEEEIATSAGARHAAEWYSPAVCIIGEPSGSDGVTIAYKGRLIANLTVSLSGSHSAGPDRTAAELAFEVWSRISASAGALRSEAPRVFDQVQARLRSVTTQSDGLQERVHVSMSFRLPPGVNPSECEELCRRSTEGLRGEHHWSFSGHEQAVVADRSNAVVRSLVQSIRSSGQSPRVKVKTGTSDMNVVAPIWNCPMAAYGPGDSALDHTPNEHIRLDEYLRSIEVLTAAIERLSRELHESAIAPAFDGPAVVAAGLQSISISTHLNREQLLSPAIT